MLRSPRPVLPDAVPELAGDGLRLRELAEADIPSWYARATDVASADLAGDPVPASIDEGAAWLERHRERFRTKTAIRWSIVPDGTNESAGTIGLAIAADDPRVADLGIVIGRAWWGRGLGTAAAGLVVRYAFGTLGLAAIRAETLQRNAASIRLLEKSGFRQRRATPGGPADDDDEACFHYVLLAPAPGPADPSR